MADELVAWSDDFLVENETIDTQHKELVRMTNEFYAGCQSGGIMARVYFFQTIQGAVHYVKTHFSSEEEIMQKAGYPEFDAHKKQHEDFVVHVTEQIGILENNPEHNPADFIKYLMDWILQHIAESDKKLVPFIRNL
jgi:hemerythrin